MKWLITRVMYFFIMVAIGDIFGLFLCPIFLEITLME